MHLSLFMYKIKAPKGQGNLSKKWKKIFFNQLYSSRIFFLYINNRIIIVLEKKKEKKLCRFMRAKCFMRAIEIFE